MQPHDARCLCGVLGAGYQTLIPKTWGGKCVRTLSRIPDTNGGSVCSLGPNQKQGQNVYMVLTISRSNHRTTKLCYLVYKCIIIVVSTTLLYTNHQHIHAHRWYLVLSVWLYIDDNWNWTWNPGNIYSMRKSIILWYYNYNEMRLACCQKLTDNGKI